ncbi:hypothetical protein GQ53DRAFT_496411 [Thozetella sp. PMI_491]|nr:hypothetical protein GQ53DRAFT_496411 [Thozetella sp. PMI_491]
MVWRRPQTVKSQPLGKPPKLRPTCGYILGRGSRRILVDAVGESRARIPCLEPNSSALGFVLFFSYFAWFLVRYAFELAQKPRSSALSSEKRFELMSGLRKPRRLASLTCRVRGPEP